MRIPFWACLFLLCSIFPIEIFAHIKRAPPFEDDTVATPPVSLGNYTQSHEDIEKSTYTCTPIGECDVCTPIEKKTVPYCMEYGNKEPVRCEWDDPTLNDKEHQPEDFDSDAILLPSFQGCRRVKRLERWRFIRFETINVTIAILSLLILVWRQRKIAGEQYERLAQRIGV
ncbi:uncharacterized protein BYT42DRAFT_612601 [Radiomyces spectabilis]|uniref:uncharacterized protein n=1 Tax=Radiomyces spectabilis TaxID=64574 RepID=UPI00221FA160|nr:uncharacterized protein BYT42DRAFT_612601 [Radiomyces spectabilis]KAI8384937.1 hypothetical protein BYT42DRAFT_612601 [Radiomyces spectabilis]